MDIDVVNEYGQSALFLAAANGRSRTVALLISMGALRISDNAGVYVNFTNVDPNSLDWMENEKEIIIFIIPVTPSPFFCSSLPAIIISFSFSIKGLV